MTSVGPSSAPAGPASVAASPAHTLPTTPTTPGPPDPYVGPRPFAREDAHLFFGRDREASELYSLTLAHPCVLLYAQSGAGKSSLLAARLAPMLEERGFGVLGPARVSGEIPVDLSESDGSNVHAFHVLQSLGASVAASRGSLAAFLVERAQAHAEAGRALTVLVVDQFEEVFTTAPARWRDREGFFAELGAALEKSYGLRIVLAMREEYLAGLEPYSHLLPEKLRARYRLERLRESQALEAVVGPLAGTGRAFQPGAARALVQNLMRVSVRSGSTTVEIPGEFVEPVHLQVVCRNLWRALPPGSAPIDASSIATLGDVDDALASYYQDCLRELAGEAAPAGEERAAREDELRAWFESALIAPDGTRGLVHKGDRETGGLDNQLVLRLEAMHLVRPEVRGGAVWYELAHDRFLGPIKRSNKAWREELLRSSAFGALLEERARRWKQTGARGGGMWWIFGSPGLLKIQELSRAFNWKSSAEGRTFPVSQDAQELVMASARALFARLILVVTGMLMLALLIVAWQANEAEKARERAVSSALLAEEERQRAVDATMIERGRLASELAREPDKDFYALALGLKAVLPAVAAGDAPPADAVQGLRDALAVVDDQVFLRPREPIQEPLISADGRHVLTVGTTELAVWDAASGARLHARSAPDGQGMELVELSRDGSLVLAVIAAGQASSGAQNVAQRNLAVKMAKAGEPDRALVLAVETGALVAEAELPRGWITRRWAPNGEGLLGVVPWPDDGGEAELWFVSTGRSVQGRKFEIADISHLEFARDGKSFVGFSRDGSARLCRLDDASEPVLVVPPLEAKGEVGMRAQDCLFAHGGASFALVRHRRRWSDPELSVRLHDARTGREIGAVVVPGGNVGRAQLSFAADDRRLAVFLQAEDEDELAVWAYGIDTATNTVSAAKRNPGQVLIQILPNGWVISKAGDDAEVLEVWSPMTEEVRTLAFPGFDRSHAYQLSNDLRRALALADERRARVLDLDRPNRSIEGRNLDELVQIARERLRHQPEEAVVKALDLPR